ncbi:helix-turn-helix domain-containing protein [Pseudonocardia humida]|uniref:Helix-turn-helix domain-containing protein n=1 Tax=Pseudonocardia humida TaxID=2800819 RepID=A0ABT1A786_9PSEU|nr:helix-turn-helix domain-containing protein [Pseudonocardia humida]MCO1658890.1 helix-turn-helix domain-containing protein [Pseudonocardia humida]
MQTDHDRQRPAVDRPSFYTAAETAEILRLDESTLYRHLRSGSFPGVKIGGRYVVPGAVIERIVADVLATGRCVNLGDWTRQWRHEQVAALAQITARDVELPGGVA